MARSSFGSTPVAMNVSDLSPLLTRPISVIWAVVMRTRLSALDGAAQLRHILQPVFQRLLRLGALEAGFVNLQMSQPVADRALAQAVEGDGFVAAEENQADRAEDDDQQRDGRAAAVAEDVAKGKFGQHVVSLRSARFEQRFVITMRAVVHAHAAARRATSARDRAWRR